MIVDRKYTGFPTVDMQLNPLQKMIYPQKDHDGNVLICGKTSSGKSTTVNLLGADVLDAGFNIVYVGSFKALVQEKVDDWNEPGHPWKHVPKTAISGDYTYDAAKLKEIDEAKIITVTPESLVSIIRNKGGERAKFLKGTRLLIIDEGHLVDDDDRGANMEASIIEILTDFPLIRLVIMSGTIPNPDHFLEWMCNLNDRDTFLVESDYRPVRLDSHYLQYNTTKGPISESERIQRVLSIVTSEEKRTQQFLVAVFSKKFGYKIVEALKAAGIQADFHNGSIKSAVMRNNIEQAFKAKSLRVLVTTTTLLTGVNLPARNVIITAPIAGGKDVKAYTLQQAAGRAGRPKYDTAGDAYFLIPAAEFDRHVQRIQAGEPILSQLAKKELLASHFLGAIALKRFANVKDFHIWFHKTLAYVQQRYTMEQTKTLLDTVIADMKKLGMLKLDDNTGALELKQRGKICAALMLDPYHFGQLCHNFNVYFSLTKTTDMDIARSLSHVAPYYSKWISKEEERALPKELYVASAKIEKGYAKHAAAIWLKLTNSHAHYRVPEVLSAAWWQVSEDLDRLQIGLMRACEESEHWTESKFSGGTGLTTEVSAVERIQLMFLRIRKGYTWEQARLAVARFTPKEMKLLASVGIHDFEEARSNVLLARQVLKAVRAQELGL